MARTNKKPDTIVSSARTQRQAAEAADRSRKTPVSPAAVACEVTLDRRAAGGRRAVPDRRKTNRPVAVERRTLQRRVKVNRRRQIDPTTCERDYSIEEIEFMGALDAYKRSSGRMFPTCSEILEVLRNLGYEKRLAAVPLPPPIPEPMAPPIAAALPQPELIP